MQYQIANAQRQYVDYIGWIIIQKAYHHKIGSQSKIVRYFFILIFQIWRLHYPISTKLQILIELTYTNNYSSLKSIIKCYFVGHSVFSNFNFHKSRNTGSTKEDVFYAFTFGNSLNIFKYGIFHHSRCFFYGLRFVTKNSF